MIFEFLLLTILQEIFKCQSVSSITIEYDITGCTDSSCLKICRIGFDVCDPNKISCSFGYFLFQNRECVRCPYQQYTSKLTIQCKDCFENPYSWDQSRICQNYYTIYDGQQDVGVFINQKTINNNLYFVETFEGTIVPDKTYQNNTQLYDVTLCEGCSSFCTPQEDDESCFGFPEIKALDPQQGVQCNDGYYFVFDSCLTCPSSCLLCSSQDNQIICSECNQGYALDFDNICKQCFTNCVDCYFDEGTQYCLECVQTSFTNFYIPSPDQKSCQSCDSSCARCEFQGPYPPNPYVASVPLEPIEYITRDQGYTDDLDNYPQRCRQCLNYGDYIALDGIECSPCLIENCLICYEEGTIKRADNVLQRTSDLDFRAELYTSSTYCQLCKSGYRLSNNQCNSETPDIAYKDCITYEGSNFSGDIKKCVRCTNNVMLNIGPTQNTCLGDCTKKISSCLNCISYQEDGNFYYDETGNLVEDPLKQTGYQCIQCQTGYYPDFFTGACLECPNRCKTCWQYSASFNHTAYVYGYTTTILKNSQRLQYGSEPTLDPMCTECQEGFDLYNGQCLGCTSDCQVNGESACTYTDTFAFCSSCENNKLQKSLVSDLSQCNECPNYCVACRERTKEEFNMVNPLFSPQNDALQKYSNLCFRLQTPVASGDYVYIDTKTMIPITCKKTTTDPQTKCKTHSTISVTVYCDSEEYGNLSSSDKLKYYSLNSIFTKKKTSQLRFQKEETFSNFQELNKNSIYSLILEVNFIPNSAKVCTFQKPTKLVTQYQQNVFSLQNFKVVFQSEDPAIRVLFELYGYLEFENINILEFKNIDLTYVNQEPKSKTYLKYFGIQLTGPLTEFHIYNQKIDKSSNKLAQFSYVLENTYTLQINNLELSYLNSKDNPFNQSFTVSGYNYSLTINGLILSYSDLTNQSFIQLNPDFYNFITISNIQISQSTISNMTFLWSKQDEGFISLKVDGIKILFSIFFNSTVIKSDYLIDTSIKNVDIVQSFFNYSDFIEANKLILENFYISNCIFANQSSLITTSAEYQNLPIYNTSIKLHTFTNLIFYKPTCYDTNCLMFISSPNNKFGIKTDITISNIQVSNAAIDMSTDILEYINSALIYFLNIGKVNIIKMKSIYNLAITVFTFQNLTSININNFVCDWNNSNYRYLSEQEQDLIDAFLIPDPGNVLILNPFNNLIEVSKDCVQQSLASLASNQFCLYISEFQIGVQIQNIFINRLFLIDTAAIYIESYKVLDYNTTQQTPYVTSDFYNGYQNEIIMISNVYCYNNTLLKYDQGQSIALIGIKSQQLQTVILTGLTYLGNHMHFYTSQLFPSAVLFFVDSQQGNIQINNLQSKENRATNSPNGLVYVVSENLTIQSSSFTSTNMISEQWLYYMAENQFTFNNQTINNMREFFKILSIGSNINVITQNLLINSTYFQDASGLDGTGLFITTKSQGIINIQNTQFLNQIGSLEQKYTTYGGCLYVDASESNLTLQLNNVKMINCVSRSQGGCIYVDTSKYTQKIQIKGSLFQQCQSLDGSILFAQFPDSSEQSPEIDIDECTMTDNNLKSFLSQIPSISLQEQQSFQSTASAVRVKNGRLKLSEIIISNINYVAIFKLETLIQFYISQGLIINNLMFIQPLLSISLNIVYGEMNLAKVTFSNNRAYYPNNTNVTDLYQIMNPPFNYQLPQQQCSLQQKYFQMFQFIDQLSDPLEDGMYDAFLLNEYETLINKYSWTDSTITFTMNSLSLGLNFGQKYNNLVMDTIFYQIIQQYNLIPPTSILQISTLSDDNIIQLSSLKITQNTCIKCIGGLFQFFTVPNNYELIQLQDVICSNNIVGYYGCFMFTANSQYSLGQLNEEIFDTNVNSVRLLQIDDVEQNLLNSQYTIYIRNGYFSSNTAVIGSGCSFLGLDVLLINNTFANNNATQMGGGIYYENSIYLNNSLQMYKNSFSNNVAQIGAAIYLFQATVSNLTKLENDLSSNNASVSGSNLYESTQRLTIQMVERQLLSIDSYSEVGINNVTQETDLIYDVIKMPKQKTGSYPKETDYLVLPSGQSISTYKYYYEYTNEQVPYNWVFRIINLNKFGEKVVNLNNGASCFIEGRLQDSKKYLDNKTYYSNFTTPTVIYFNQDKGGYDMDDLIITFDPQLPEQFFLELRFKCESVKIPIYNEYPPYNIYGYNTNYYLYAKIRTFPCQIGEAYANSQCVACQGKKYNVDLSNEQCQEIDQAKMAAVTPVALNLNKGYWRPYINNDKTEQCKNNLANCLGGWEPGDPSCKFGHIGALCEQCDLYVIRSEESYAPTQPYSCGTCAGSFNSILATLIATSLVSVYSTILSVKGQKQANQQFLIERAIKLMGVRLNPNSGNLANFIKVLTNYSQIIQILGTFQLPLPTALTSTPKSVADPGNSQSKSLDCILKDMTSINTMYFFMIWQMILPTFYLLCFLIYFSATVICLKQPADGGLVATAFIYMFMLIQPTLVQGFVSLASSQLISGISWVQTNNSYRSDTPTHKLWAGAFAAPMIVLWGVLLPLFFFSLVYKNRHKLDDYNIKTTIGYFYNEYTKETYFWEFVKIFEKELMYIFLTFYQDEVIVKGILIAFILLIYALFQFEYSPYDSKILNGSDKFSTIVCLISIILGVLAFQCYQVSVTYLVIIIYVIIGFINLFFILKMIFYIFEGYLLQLSDQLDILRDKINAKYPDLVNKSHFYKHLLTNRAQVKKRVNSLWSILRDYTKLQLEYHKKGYESFKEIKENIQKHSEDEEKPLIQTQNGDLVESDPLGLKGLRDKKSKITVRDSEINSDPRRQN